MRMNSEKKIKIIDVTGKKSITCPKCGFINDVPPRTISMKKLRHIQDVKQLCEWHKKVGVPGIGNVRLMICLRCEQPIIGIDQFSIHNGHREE